MSPAGGPRMRTIPDGDDRERLTCPDCGYVAYENPKIVAGVLAVHEGQVLLCRRAIEPRRGYWTLPAGFLELGESPEEGALREAYEEARCRPRIDGLLGMFTVRRISQVQIFYRARLDPPEFEAGPESEEVALFPLDALPRDELAFPTVAWSLDAYLSQRASGVWTVASNPNDPPELP